MIHEFQLSGITGKITSKDQNCFKPAEDTKLYQDVAAMHPDPRYVFAQVQVQIDRAPQHQPPLRDTWPVPFTTEDEWLFGRDIEYEDTRSQVGLKTNNRRDDENQELKKRIRKQFQHMEFGHIYERL